MASILNLPCHVMLDIFKYLPVRDVVSCLHVCRDWHAIGQDEFLWKHMLVRDYIQHDNVEVAESLKKAIRPPHNPEGATWQSEYVRMRDQVPKVKVQAFTQEEQVLHVAVSHDGEDIVAVCRNGVIKIWRLKGQEYSFLQEIKPGSENEDEYLGCCESFFSPSDQMLLATNHKSRWAIFKRGRTKYSLQCILHGDDHSEDGWSLGHWVSDDFFVHGELLMYSMFQFSLYGFGKTVGEIVTGESNPKGRNAAIEDYVRDVREKKGLGTSKTNVTKFLGHLMANINDPIGFCNSNPRVFKRPKKARKVASKEEIARRKKWYSWCRTPEEETKLKSIVEDYDIFLTCTSSCPYHKCPDHQIFKNITGSFDYSIAKSDCPGEKSSNNSVAVNMEAFVVAVCLSHDQKLLFVNTRSFHEDPDTFDEHIYEVKVIDLDTFTIQKKIVDTYICPNLDKRRPYYLDATDDMIGLPSETNVAIYDRHYGCYLSTLSSMSYKGFCRHKDIVNCVAFNPADSEMCVTASDDKNVVIWWSARKVREARPRKSSESSRSRKTSESARQRRPSEPSRTRKISESKKRKVT